jgi:hypothetical protein
MFLEQRAEDKSLPQEDKIKHEDGKKRHNK